MLCRICVAQIQPGNHILDDADCTDPTRHHELDHTDHADHTDHTDHTDRDFYLPCLADPDHKVHIDDLVLVVLRRARTTLHDGVNHTPGAFFQAPFLDNHEGASTDRFVFGKLLLRCSNADLFLGHRHTIPTVEISTMENRPRGV